MTRSFLKASLLVASIATATSNASAQYEVLFPGSTVGGDESRGAGFLFMGLGQYNLNTALAHSVWTDTILRQEWAIEANAQYHARAYARQKQQKALSTSRSLAEIQARQLSRPEPSDIYRGDALNAVVREIADLTRMSPSLLRATKVPVPGGSVDRAPWLLAQDGVVISTTRLTNRKEWPVLLREPAFDRAFDAYHKAIDAAMEAAARGTLGAGDIDSVDRALDGLRTRISDLTPSSHPESVRDARTFLDGLVSSARFLHAVRSGKLLAELEGYGGTTAGDLVEFVTRSRLQFAPATTPQERDLYAMLHPLLVRQRDLLRADGNTSVTAN
ncbi:hypothetical protein [Aquisphaera insulae]|uniref:hypothetical protein n=1 Tax=Aquisphaera insulae TaxID=2712864 RepID=UPI0013EC89A9|nr:hypothetical protein [Aquisphaera insulae]